MRIGDKRYRNHLRFLIHHAFKMIDSTSVSANISPNGIIRNAMSVIWRTQNVLHGSGCAIRLPKESAYNDL